MLSLALSFLLQSCGWGQCAAMWALPLVTKHRSQHRLPKVAIRRFIIWPLTSCRQGSQKRGAGQDEMRQLKEEALANGGGWVIQGSGKRLRQRASRLFSPSDDSWDGVQKNRCVPGTVAAVTLTQQPCGAENMKVGWSRAYYPRLALSLAIYAGSDCNTWPQGMGVHGAEVMGAAGEVPVSPPLCFGVVENRLAFGARGCSQPCALWNTCYHFLWPAIR